MGITLIVTRSYDENFNETGETIHESDWNALVESQAKLRFNSETITLKNPKTGQIIEMASPEGSTEVLVNGSWHPFLNFRNGKLRMQYLHEFENSDHPIRREIVWVAGHFSAIITSDAGDEILHW